MTDSQKLAALIFGADLKTPEEYEALYPPRALPEGARVTRVAPSPTGYLHLGVLFAALINRRIADASGGVFYLRIEDTDQKREVAGGMEDILGGLLRFGIAIDEGFVAPGREEGAYGPYRQSERAPIYHSFAKRLMEQGYAYPCFLTAQELADVRARQEAEKARTGCYGKWAKYRDLPFEEAAARIRAGEPYVVRLKSPGNESNRVRFEDGIKGKIEMPENDEDFVLLKSDGIPTYHFAHAVDDHLMRTTHVLRGDEWISSTPKHLQLFRLLGFKPPKYVHFAPILKEDGGGKRKISKRKDPEAAVRYFAEQGYPAESVIEYLLSIANSDYEEWRRANPDAPSGEFKLNLKKMSVSGALFDARKLEDVSKNVIAGFSAERVVDGLLAWAREQDPAFYALLAADPDYARALFSIDRGGKKPRKDLAKWSDAKSYAAYFYDALFEGPGPLPEQIDPGDAAAVIERYLPVYDPAQERDAWFAAIKGICPELGFAPEIKEYKQAPQAYRGHAGDVAAVLRLAVTGRQNSPDLCAIMRLLGKERVLRRLEAAAAHYRSLVRE